jgi:CRP-like cAMP-binding protein
MTASRSTISSNTVLKNLSAADACLIKEHLEEIDLPHGFLISKPFEPSKFVYCLTSGIGSVVAVSSDGRKAEAGMFGREGFAPTAASAGVDTDPYEIIIQVAGEGHRLRLAALKDVASRSRALDALLEKFVQAFAAQVSYTALANAYNIDQRLARWLLMCHDRIEGDVIEITHEYMALMLATRRPSVTDALHVLEGQGLIRSKRGLVIIRNRPELEEYTGSSYRPAEEYYQRLMG